jgi:anti-sigma28 factor (negative regulator of flagellin synthesis)
MNDAVQRTLAATPESNPAADAEVTAHRLMTRQEARRHERQRLARIRRAVQRGEYENDLKIAVAADRLLERLLTEK